MILWSSGARGRGLQWPSPRGFEEVGRCGARPSGRMRPRGNEKNPNGEKVKRPGPTP